MDNPYRDKEDLDELTFSGRQYHKLWAEQEDLVAELCYRREAFSSFKEYADDTIELIELRLTELSRLMAFEEQKAVRYRKKDSAECKVVKKKKEKKDGKPDRADSKQ